MVDGNPSCRLRVRCSDPAANEKMARNLRGGSGPFCFHRLALPVPYSSSMTLAILFWVLMIVWLCFGLWSEYTPGQPYPFSGKPGRSFLIFLSILGWATFGAPVHWRNEDSARRTSRTDFERTAFHRRTRRSAVHRRRVPDLIQSGSRNQTRRCKDSARCSVLSQISRRMKWRPRKPNWLFRLHPPRPYPVPHGLQRDTP